MALWKVEIFEKSGDIVPVRWGVVNAKTQQEATEIMARKMGDNLRADAKPVLVSEIASLPAGTFFWTDGNA